MGTCHIPIKDLIVFHICVAAGLMDSPRHNSGIYGDLFASGMIKVTCTRLTAVLVPPLFRIHRDAPVKEAKLFQKLRHS